LAARQVRGPDALGLVGRAIFRPVFGVGALGRVFVSQTGFLRPPDRDGVRGRCIAGWPDIQLWRTVGMHNRGGESKYQGDNGDLCWQKLTSLYLLYGLPSIATFGHDFARRGMLV
jgi:hypothetical protein